MALTRRAHGIERHQFRCRVAGLQGGAAFGLFPLRRAERVQRCRVRVRTGVPRDDVQLRNRDVELGFVGVVKFEKFHIAFAQIEVYQSPIACDAVLFVHHRIADFQFGEIAQPVVERGFALGGLSTAARRASGVEFGFGDES